jgi:predicted restriction endonuclease
MLLSILQSFQNKVMVSKANNENNSCYGLKQFGGKEISLPQIGKYYSLMDNFTWHQ